MQIQQKTNPLILAAGGLGAVGIATGGLYVGFAAAEKRAQAAHVSNAQTLFNEAGRWLKDGVLNTPHAWAAEGRQLTAANPQSVVGKELLEASSKGLDDGIKSLRFASDLEAGTAAQAGARALRGFKIGGGALAIGGVLAAGAAIAYVATRPLAVSSH